MSIMPTKNKHLCARQVHNLSNISNSYTSHTTYASSQIHTYRYIIKGDISELNEKQMSGSIVFLHYPSDERKINVCLGLAQHITTTFSIAGNAECVKRCTQYYPKGFYAVCIPHKI